MFEWDEYNWGMELGEGGWMDIWEFWTHIGGKLTARSSQ